MHEEHLVWSGTTSDFPGAGLYVGLAGHSDHCLLGVRLSKRQLRVFTGATVRVTDELTWPVYYYALRDPSAVAVRPIEVPPLPNGMRHVNLSFRFDKTPPAEPAGKMLGDPSTSAAFLMTIGLPKNKEQSVFEELLDGHHGQTWSELHERICKNGRKPLRGG